MTLSPETLIALNEKFETASPSDILCWASEIFPSDLAASSSFQTQGVPLLHHISQAVPNLPIIFLDTGYHFPETLQFRDQLIAQWGLKVQVWRAKLARGEFVRQYGPDLYSRDPNRCCYINKVEPMKRATAHLKVWISGVRRDQSAARANLKILEYNAEGVLRIHPMATWTRQDIWRYMHHHNLPDHPLLAQGYVSIGCAPCTRPVLNGDDDERAGRWQGQGKVECGLHTMLRDTKDEDDAS